MRRIALALSVLLALPLLAGAARAEGPVVVELYTSQGCSSCPPADAILTELAARDDVIALALHVDYWDYIGWRDDFANPAFTKRQKRYAKATGERSIYTPQIIVGGRHQIVGAQGMEIAHAIKAAMKAPQPVAVRLSRSDNGLTVHVTAGRETPAGSILYLVTYAPEAVREIERGENAGRRIVYSNIVLSWDEIGTVAPGETADFTAVAPSAGEVAALVQAPGPGAILGAARLD